ncbi:hypothetical protein [Pseudotamlana agarivorans]|uniref:hypothetical protein n=1 Tax=Pseudotamlana agarivorans TaxID=481183 RepID=UPI0008315ED8|nr:hypothetical protein [Tamlana agarivorans]
MDYHKLYSHFYDKTFIITKRVIISKFKKAKVKNRPYEKFRNDMLMDLRGYIAEKFENVLKGKAAESYIIFKNRHEYVEGDSQAVLKQILEEEVLNAFVYSQGYTYNGFVADLAIETCLNDIISHYVSHSGYYELVYEQERYNYIFLEDFKGISYESSSEFREMQEFKYPSLKEEREKANLGNNVVDFNIEVEKGLGKKKKCSSDENKMLAIINIFNDNERALLLSVFNDQLIKNKLSKTPLTELVKLFKIIGHYEDLSIFTEISKNSTFYVKSNKGLGYYKSSSRKLELIDSTIAKLNKNNISFMIDLLKSKRLDLL